MELTVLEKTIPIKAIPEETLNAIIMGPLLDRCTKLLLKSRGVKG